MVVKYTVKNTLFLSAVGLGITAGLSLSSAFADSQNDVFLRHVNNDRSMAASTAHSKEIFKLKKSFVRQNLPAPDVTGSVGKKIQLEDDALISAIISQDLKRTKIK